MSESETAQPMPSLDAVQEMLRGNLVASTSEVVAAYVGRNEVLVDDLTKVINTVYAALSNLGHPSMTGTPVVVVGVTDQKPAVDINDSVTDDYIICLEDGKKLKMLKRHLQTSYKMTPEQYRTKWGLPADYPMTAPNYAEVRSNLAKQIGLGTNSSGRPAAQVKKAATRKKTSGRRKAA